MRKGGGASQRAVPVLKTLGVEGIFREMPLVRNGDGPSEETAAVLADEAGGGGTKDPPDARSLALRQVEASESLARHLARTSYVLGFVTLILLAFCATVAIQLSLFLARISEGVEAISNTLTPTTVSSAIESVQDSLSMTRSSMSNFFDFSTDVSKMGEYLVTSLNRSTELVEQANIVGSRLLDHPMLTMRLGGGGD